MNDSHKNKGFTLPEVLIALAISSIIMLGVFGSYLMFNNTYYFQRDLTNQSNTTRNIIDIITRDLRMAGFSIMNATASNSIVSEPIVLINTASNSISPPSIVPADCGEGIIIQYDLFDINNGNARIETKYVSEYFTDYKPFRCRLIRTKTYLTIPYSTGAQVTHPTMTDTTEVLADYIYDLSFELFDKNYNHLAGRRSRDNASPDALNYVNFPCQSNIDNHTPCSQTGYDKDVAIVDIFLQTIAPEENPTLQDNATYGRRFVYDVSTTIKFRNVIN